MPTIICGKNFFSTATEGSFPTCDQVDENFDSLIALATAICAGAEEVYFEDHLSNLLAVPAADLPLSSPNKIEVTVNGQIQYDTALMPINGTYTVNAADEIQLTFVPSTPAQIRIKYFKNSF